MSTAFNRELELAIKAVYTQLEATELIQKNLEQGAKLGLYYAHGITDKAAEKLETDQLKSKLTGEQLHEANNASEVCNNIVTAATAAATDARNTNSLASTAAVNIQAAADSLTTLAGDVAVMGAIAKSKNRGDKIELLVDLASQLTQAVAEKAENTTLKSLNTTIEAAQSRAAVGLTQAKTLVTDMKSLIKILDQNFEALQTKVNADAAALETAVIAENEQDGIYKTALQEEKAMTYSEKFINKHVNHDLRYIQDGNTGERFTIAFDAFDEKGLLLENGKIKVEKVLREYRIIFTQQDDATTFDLHAAKASSHFFTIKPESKPDYSMDFVTAEYIAASNSEIRRNTAKDYQGQALKRGIPYVAFVYLKYSCDYQNEMDDTDGLLSLPSLPFTLLTELPAASRPVLHFYKHNVLNGGQCSISNAMRVSFKVSDLMFQGVDLSKIMNFRVLLFKENDELASKLNLYTDKQLEQLFQLDEQYRLGEENYLMAEQAYNTAIATGSPDREKLKEALALAQGNYRIATQKYDHQLEVIESLNEAKISNFFLDVDILNSIPDAFGQEAQIVDQVFIEQLKAELTAYQGREQALETELETLNDLLDKLSSQLKSEQSNNSSLTQQLDKSKKELQTLQAEAERIEELNSILIAAELDIENVSELIYFLENLPRDIVIEAEILATLLDLFNKIAEKQKQIAEQSQQLSASNATIFKLQREISPVNDQIDEVKNQQEMVQYNISVLTTEVDELESGTVYGDIEKIRDTMLDIEKTLAELQSSEGNNKKEIKRLEKDLKDLEKELKELEKDERGETDQSVRKYALINQNGDFTDNYGEPIISGESYTALVFSVIKPTEPDALPLFQPVYSPFSVSQTPKFG